MYWSYIRHTKHIFTLSLIFLCRGTTIVVTAGEGIELNECVEREDGKVVGIKLGKRAVWISNHQQYGDWIYTWVFFYIAELHDGELCGTQVEIQEES